MLAGGGGRRASAGRVRAFGGVKTVCASAAGRLAAGAGDTKGSRGSEVEAGGVGRRSAAGRVSAFGGVKTVCANAVCRLAAGAGDTDDNCCTDGLDWTRTVPASCRWGEALFVAVPSRAALSAGAASSLSSLANRVEAGVAEAFWATGWLAGCGSEVEAGGVGRRLSAGPVNVFGGVKTVCASAVCRLAARAGDTKGSCGSDGPDWTRTVPASCRRGEALFVVLPSLAALSAGAASSLSSLANRVEAGVAEAFWATGWLAGCGSDVVAGGVGRRVSAGPVNDFGGVKTVCASAVCRLAARAGDTEGNCCTDGSDSKRTAPASKRSGVVFAGSPWAASSLSSLANCAGVGVAEAFWATGWLAGCCSDVPAGGVSRRVSAGPVSAFGRVKTVRANATCRLEAGAGAGDAKGSCCTDGFGWTRPAPASRRVGVVFGGSAWADSSLSSPANSAWLPPSPSPEGRSASSAGREGAAACAAEAIVTSPGNADRAP